MMKFSIFLLLNFVLFVNAQAEESPYLISGFDDVLRQAENTGVLKSALKILEADKTFAGMPELYRQLTVNEVNPKFVLVSAISTWFDGRVESFLEQNEMPSHSAYLRNWLTEWSIEDFKLNRIKTIIDDRPLRKFIVIFDNSEASLRLSERLHQLYPIKVKAIYLRQVVLNKRPESATYFYTAFDIAMNEYMQKRLPLAALEKVAADVLSETRKYLIFPPYAICPKDYVSCPKENLEVKEVCQLVQDHVRNLCLR